MPVAGGSVEVSNRLKVGAMAFGPVKALAQGTEVADANPSKDHQQITNWVYVARPSAADRRRP